MIKKERKICEFKMDVLNDVIIFFCPMERMFIQDSTVDKRLSCKFVEEMCEVL